MTSPTVRRMIDIAVVVITVPVVVPLCLALMALIRLESRGSPLFAQRRVGLHQAPFTLFKLRTMSSGTGDIPSHEVSQSQVTKIGRILRVTKLDELPQLWNVLRGEMTFVGPRPCLPSQSQLIGERAARSVFDHLPGITGPAQIRRIDMAQPVLLAQIEEDYFKSATGLSDLAIVVQTVCGAGRGDVAGGR